MAQTRTAKRKPGRPKKAVTARDEDQSLAILRAAEEEFGEKGFDGASVSSIAERAGVAQPLINYYFASKARLWESVIENINDALMAALALPDENEIGAEAAFRQRIHKFILFSAARPSLALIIASALNASGPRLHLLREGYISHLERDTTRLICEAFGFSPRDKRMRLLFPFILSACVGPFLHQSYMLEQHRTDPTTPRQAEIFADMAVELLASGIKAVADGA